MAILESNKKLFLSWELKHNLEYNFIDVIPEFHLITCIISNELKIFIKGEETNPATFYDDIFNNLNQVAPNQEFFFLQEDERQLATIYKIFSLSIVKDWFTSINKIINKDDILPIDTLLLETIAFELKAYNQSPNKYSTHFSFTDLLLQRLEAKIELSKKYSLQQDSNIIDLLKETDYTLCFTHTFPASKQVFASTVNLHPKILVKLQEKGIQEIYEYQKETMENILQDKNVVITAPTGNGKTESFLLPILQKLFQWKQEGRTGIKAILFYPTKALVADQITKIIYYTSEIGVNCVQLDSDVEQKERIAVYQNNELDLLITTPDLIHYSLHKQEFRDWIAATNIIVFDEIHTYTGTFGTHIYYFLRKLERVLVKGKNIQYIGASATIANPVEFTKKLFNREMVHVDCKTPKKNTTELYCVQRNKLVNKQESIFQLVSVLTQQLQDEKIIVFRNSQQESERTFVILQKIKNKKIALHRAGLGKEQRTDIERKLRENEIDVVVTTTTLEVGIDIGGITTIITPIVPVNRLLQRIGRAGRGNQPAKIFLELEHDPISYYYSTHADSYLKDVSAVNITTENESIASQHKELELARDQPGNKLFSLRNVNEKIDVKTESGYKVTEKELPQAFYEYYPFADILHNSQHYKVDRIESDNKKSLTAIVRQTREKMDYRSRTRPIVEKKVFTNAKSVEVEFIGDIEIKLSECKIELEYQGNVVNYREKVLMDTYTYEYTSKCVIWNFEEKMGEYVQQEREKGVELGSTVHTLSHVLYKAAKMIIHCGNDLMNMENSIGMWKIVFVDNAINGNGMSELFFAKREEIWERAVEILKDCECGIIEGCIKCTMDYGCQRKNKGLLN
jgi:DEAD/DEAH box helicase domain-containing protein